MRARRVGTTWRTGTDAREATVARIEPDDARAELVATLLDKVNKDQYPSSTMLDLIEELLTPEETPAYVVFLQDRIRSENYPSIPLLKRLTALV